MTEPVTFLDGRVNLYAGDCREVMAALPAGSIDAIVTDPPYELGFMGKGWDKAGVAFDVATWRAALRVLKPGGHMVAFSGTRTYHRMACAIEDAGFEIRDMVAWTYGSGFPKSLDVSKAIDKAAGVERRVVGTEKVRDIRNGHGRGQGDGIHASNRDGPVYMERELTEPGSDEAAEWQGWGTALKPAQEPVCLARKPLSEGTVAANVLAHGTGALNIDACRVATDESTVWPNGPIGYHGGGTGGVGGGTTGRWPANLVHDGSEEVLAGFPETKSGSRKAGEYQPLGMYANAIGEDGKRPSGMERAMPALDGDSGSAARFFYTAKADADDRIGSKHPTVKPVDLMRWLVRLVTPPGGTILDPFAGTGTTGEAAWREGFSAILIEREAEYREDIARRMRLCLSGTAERKREIIKAKGRAEETAGPLFGGTP